MARVRYISLLLPLLTAACASQSSALAAPSSDGSGDFGVVLMAHGGSPEWNDGVLGAVEPLRDEHAIEVAFGMADAVSIQDAVRKLEAHATLLEHLETFLARA
jgi:hypothetical protein